MDYSFRAPSLIMETIGESPLDFVGSILLGCAVGQIEILPTEKLDRLSKSLRKLAKRRLRRLKIVHVDLDCGREGSTFVSIVWSECRAITILMLVYEHFASLALIEYIA